MKHLLLISIIFACGCFAQRAQVLQETPRSAPRVFDEDTKELWKEVIEMIERDEIKKRFKK